MKLRGFWEEADISLIAEQGTGLVKKRTYNIVFNDFTLNDHSQNNLPELVEWQGGIVRLPYENYLNKEWKALKVIKLINGGSEFPLELIVVDESTDEEKIKEGANIEVNFYPGYKLYLFADADVSVKFNKEKIFPVTKEEKKNPTWCKIGR